MQFQNRFEAGCLLANALQAYANQKNVMVLALPRGGVMVADPIAKQLKAPLDLLLVKKLGVPGHEELAFGAVSIDDVVVLNKDVITSTELSPETMDVIIQQKKKSVAERNALYRQNKKSPDVAHKVVIIVDDGIATGATMQAAIQAIHTQQPQKIIVAVPVADKIICDTLKKTVDEVICLHQPEWLSSIGYWYEDFTQVTDEEVLAMMRHYRK